MTDLFHRDARPLRAARRPGCDDRRRGSARPAAAGTRSRPSRAGPPTRRERSPARPRDGRAPGRRGALPVGLLARRAHRDHARDARPTDAELFAPFWDVYDSITKSYVGEVDREKLIQGAIDGMIGALDDPYSSYMSPEELQRARESIGGEFSGVGAEVTTRPTDSATGTCATIGPSCRLVSSPRSTGRPPSAPDLRSGDVITAVDGRTVDGETLDEAIARIRGATGHRR